MFYGIAAGATWAVETIILGIALSMAPFVSTEQAIFLAPFVSTFIHDAFSALWAALYNGVRGNLKNVYKAAFKTKSGKFVMLAAVIGGPIGMTGYVLAINYMGASIGAVASAVFPAIGAILAYFFLKEKMQWYRWIFLLATLLGVYGLSYSPELNITDFWLGIAGAMMCAFGWGIEAVILAKCMQDPDVKDEYALQIRQTTSALVYGIVRIVDYFKNRDISPFFAGELILGVVLVGIGLFSFLNPGGLFAILPFIFGILVLVEGISKLQRALMLRRYGYPRWVAALVLAIAIMVLGVVLVLNPFGALVMTVRVLGAVILVDGLTGLWVSLILKKNF